MGLWELLSWRWTDDVEECRRRQRAAVLKAAELDPGDGLALANLAYLRVRDGDLFGARETVERAIGVGANHADALALLARYVATLLDRPNEAVSLMNRSFVLNPHAPTWYFLHHIRVAYFGRLFELALDHFARIKSDPAASILPIRPQMMFRILALAQLGREVGYRRTRTLRD